MRSEMGTFVEDAVVKVLNALCKPLKMENILHPEFHVSYWFNEIQITVET